MLSWSMVLCGVRSWGCPVGVMVRWTDLTRGGLLRGVLSWDRFVGVLIRWICRDCSCVVLGCGVFFCGILFMALPYGRHDLA